MTENSNLDQTPPQEKKSPPPNSFKRAVYVLLAMMATAVLAQNLFDWVYGAMDMLWLGILGAIVLFGIYIFDFWGSLKRILHTPYFSISCLLAITLATALGTFILQNPASDIFVQRYGMTGSKVLKFFNVQDVFHSWWYVGFYVMLLASLLRASSFRAFTKENLGFHLAHLCPFVILAGVWFDYFYGMNGIINLEVGDTKDMVLTYDVNNKYIADSMQLPFKIRLDSFASQKHEPDHRIQIWKMDSTWHASNMGQAESTGEPPKILASLPIDIGVIHKIYGTDIYFRTTKAFPNFTFDYTYPVLNDTVAPVAPGVFIDMETEHGTVPMLLRSDIPGREKLADLQTVGAWLEYYYELPADVKAVLAKAKSEENRIIFSGKEEKVYFLVNNDLTEKPIVNGEFHPFPKGDDPAYGFSVRFLANNSDYVSAEPSTLDDQWVNPVAFVEVWRKGQESSEVYLYSTTEDRSGGHYQIPGSEFFLAMESVRDMETKYWRSDLSVVDESGNTVKQKVVKVNEIMVHKGYRFYQTDYDPNNPRFSGIGVSKEPGLYIVYLGFFLLVAGCLIMLYYRKKEDEPSTPDF